MLDMASVVEDSSTRTPLIFVLSPGVVSLFVKVKNYIVLVCNLFALLSANVVQYQLVHVMNLLDRITTYFAFERKICNEILSTTFVSFHLTGSNQCIVTAC